MHEEKDIVKKLSGIMQIEITKDNKKSIWSKILLTFNYNLIKNCILFKNNFLL
jgi:hypothetical protein